MGPDLAMENGFTGCSIRYPFNSSSGQKNTLRRNYVIKRIVSIMTRTRRNSYLWCEREHENQRALPELEIHFHPIKLLTGRN